MKRIAVLILGVIVALYAEPARTQDTILTVEKTANQKACFFGEACVFTIKICNKGVPLSGEEIVFTDALSSDNKVAGKLVSASGSWNCEAKEIISGKPSYGWNWECKISGISLGTNECTTLEITTEFTQENSGLLARNCAHIGSSPNVTPGSYTKGFSDCSDDIAIGSHWPEATDCVPQPGWAEGCPGQASPTASKPGSDKPTTAVAKPSRPTTKTVKPKRPTADLGVLPGPPGATSAVGRPRRSPGSSRQPTAVGRLPSTSARPPAAGPPVGSVAIPRR